MGLVLLSKARRLPPEPVVRGHGVADRYVKRIAQAVRALPRQLLTEQVLAAFASAAANRNEEEAVRGLDQALGAAPWDKLRDSVAAVLLDLARESSAEEAKSLKLLPPRIAKAAKAKPVVPVVAVPQATLQWVQDRSSVLVREIGEDVRERLRGVLHDGFQQGLHVSAMTDDIKRTVGLLERERNAVNRRRALALERGIPRAQADAAADRYAAELHQARAERIGRTESIAAESEGRMSSWTQAVEDGSLPKNVQRRWISAAESENPDRPCPICLSLSDQITGLRDPYSSIDGPVQAPPAHPQCRCTEVLVVAEEEG